MQGRWAQPLEERGGRLLALCRDSQMSTCSSGLHPAPSAPTRALCASPAPARAPLDLDSESRLPSCCCCGGGDCGGCRVVQAGWEAGRRETPRDFAARF